MHHAVAFVLPRCAIIWAITATFYDPSRCHTTTVSPQAQVGAEQRLRTYIHAINELELSLVIIMREQGEDKDVLDAMLWLWEVSDSLVPLLKIPTQEAVAIFAHFCIL